LDLGIANKFHDFFNFRNVRGTFSRTAPKQNAAFLSLRVSAAEPVNTSAMYCDPGSPLPELRAGSPAPVLTCHTVHDLSTAAAAKYRPAHDDYPAFNLECRLHTVKRFPLLTEVRCCTLTLVTEARQMSKPVDFVRCTSLNRAARLRAGSSQLEAIVRRHFARCPIEGGVAK
jgi:hypothetical protein